MQSRRLLLSASFASFLLAASLIITPAFAQDATPEATPEASATVPNVTASYVLADTPIADFQNALLPNTVENDRGFLLGGIGSDLWHGATDAEGEYWMITDRGPNGTVTVDDKDRTTFPIPGFDPVILHIKAADGTITILDAHPILTQSGKAVTGTANLDKHDDASYDFSGQTKLDFNPNGLDTEGLAHTSAGDFWIAEEYAPSILHLDATGKVLKRFVPAGLDYTGADYPVEDSLPAIFSQRRGNRGFEGLTLSADEKTVYVVLQSPLYNPDSATGKASRNTRVLAFDVATEKVTAEYVYVFDDAVEFGGEKNTPGDMKLSAVAFVNPTTLLIDERTDTNVKLYSVDLTSATNILGTAWDDPATAPSLEATTDLAAAGVTVLPKTFVIDLSAEAAALGKIEGLSVLDSSTIAIANDNDFNIGDFDADGNVIPQGAHSELLTIALPNPLP